MTPGGRLFQADQDVQGAVGEGEHRDAQVFAQQMGGAAAADDDFDTIAHHLQGQGKGVVQSLGVDKDLVLLPGGQDLDAFDQRLAGCKNADAYFFWVHVTFLRVNVGRC